MGILRSFVILRDAQNLSFLLAEILPRIKFGAIGRTE